MIKLDLSYLIKWIGDELIDKLCEKRKELGEIKRERKLGTIEILLLCLGVSIHSERPGLHDILRTVTGDLGIKWTVSVPAFCKARFRFSPGVFPLRLPTIG